MNILEHLEEMLPSAQSINDGLLMDVVRANEETEYGEERGFSSIESVSDYKRQVPFTNYDSYREYISRMTKGEKNILTVYPIDMYAVTSGSVGAPKRIPVSDWALTSNVAYYYDLPRETYERYLLEKTGETYDERRQVCLAMATESHVEDGTQLTTFSGGLYYAIQEELLPKLACDPKAMYGVSIEDYMGASPTYLRTFSV